MRTKTLMISGLLLAAALSGCAGSVADTGWPAPLPLGESFEPYRPPLKPAVQIPPPGTVEKSTGGLAMTQALALALMHSPDLAASAWEVRSKEAHTLQAGLLPNPELEVEVENFGGSGEARGFRASETTIQLSQLVELAGKRTKRQRVAARELDLAGWDYEIQRVRVFSRTCKAFIDVLTAQDRLALYQEFVSLAEQVLDVVAERVRAGKVSPVEETRARVSLASRRIEHERERHELTAARMALEAAWGGSVSSFGNVLGNLEELPVIPPIDLLVRRISGNPEIARWGAEMEMRRAAVVLEKAWRFPDLTLSGGVKRLQEIEDTAFVMGMSIPLQLFDRNQGGTLEAEYRLARAEEQNRALYVRVNNDLTQACQQLSRAWIEATSLKTHVLPGARSAFEAFGEGFRQGKFNYLDVLDAQRTFFEAKARYIQSLADLHKAVVEVERLTGAPLNEGGNSAG